MTKNLTRSALETLAYHDLFDYPLTQQQLHRFCPVKTTQGKISLALKELILEKKVAKKSSFFYLSGRGFTTQTRVQREKYSKVKLKKARKLAETLRYIPYIQMVAITGALAMNNSHKDDDIDLLVVSLTNALWTTRLFSNIFLHRNRRKPGKPEVKDKACLNIFLNCDSLKIRTQNLYIAHEIAQTRPIWQRGNTYNSFANDNSWIKNYLPNWEPYQPDSFSTYPQSILSPLFSKLSLLESSAKLMQLFYMRKKRTREKIGDSQIFLHPRNTKDIILNTYRKRLGEL